MTDEARTRTARPKALEFFAGIGGFSQATHGVIDVRAAFDLSSHTLQVMAHNLSSELDEEAKPALIQRDVSTFTPEEFAAYDAQIWWMSPPCQPYTVRGLQRDLEDHRAKAFLHMLDAVEQVMPENLAMENVKGFWESEARQKILGVLKGAGYEVHEQVLCPSELGVPARRERYYLVASREELVKEDALEQSLLHDPPEKRKLKDYLDGDELDEETRAALEVSEQVQEKFAHAMRIFEWDDPVASLNCFTSAYGKTFRYSGAYVREADGKVRFFSARELLRLLGFSESFEFPAGMTRKQKYRYIGNSLSLPAVRHVLRRLACTLPESKGSPLRQGAAMM